MLSYIRGHLLPRSRREQSIKMQHFHHTIKAQGCPLNRVCRLRWGPNGLNLIQGKFAVVHDNSYVCNI